MVILYLAPFVYEEQLQRLTSKWQSLLSAYQFVPRIVVAQPPYDTGEIDCRGYWLKPDGKTEERRIKQFRKHVSIVLVELLKEVNKYRPRVVLGEGQGGIVVAMSSFPLIVERACRDKALSSQQMEQFRRAWSGVVSLIVADPVFGNTSNNDQNAPFALMQQAFPQVHWNHPRDRKSVV